MSGAQALVDDGGILAPQRRALTIGMLVLIALFAFEQLAVATVMPVVALALDGMALYAAAFGVAMATGIVGMVLAGRWSDRAGPAPPLWAGIAAFAVGVLTAGAAADMLQLVAGRALQGLGGGLMSVGLYVVVGQAYPSALHARIFSAFAAAWVLPVVVGPALAGWIAQQFGWRWVFLAAALLALPAAWLLRPGLAALPPAARTPDRDGAPSLVVALLIAACAGLLYAAHGHTSMWWLLPALFGIGVLVPRLLPSGTLQARSGLPAVIALRGLAAAAFFCGEVLIPLLLVSERGLTPVQAGLVLTTGALGWSAGSWYQGDERRVSGEAGRVRALRLGLSAIGLGTLVLPLALWPALPIAVVALAWTCAGVGIGLVYPTLSVLTLALAAPTQQGRASSALQLSDSLFSAVVLALVSNMLFALQPWSTTAAYVAGFGFAAALALGAAVLAARVRQTSARRQR